MPRHPQARRWRPSEPERRLFMEPAVLFPSADQLIESTIHSVPFWVKPGSRCERRERPHTSAFCTSGGPASKLARLSLGKMLSPTSRDREARKVRISAAYSKRGLFGQVHSFREYRPERERNRSTATRFGPQLAARNGAVPVVLARDDRLRRKLSEGGLVHREELKSNLLQEDSVLCVRTASGAALGCPASSR